MRQSRFRMIAAIRAACIFEATSCAADRNL
jgi:hypothetical protein